MDYDLEKDILRKKLELAEKSIELGEITRTKWLKMDALKIILQQEELVLRDIAIFTKELQILNHTVINLNGSLKTPTME
jgi:hypothetical protein